MKLNPEDMLNVETMDVDLSIVKKERIELEDYGQNTGNILDNFISEHDYDEFPHPSMPCGEEDVNVDWLSSFFDEPIHDNMSGLNPPLSDISSTHHTSKMTSIHCNSDILLDSTFSEDYINSANFNETDLKLSSTTSIRDQPALRNDNPFLSQANKVNDNNKLKNDELTIKIEEESNSACKTTDMQIDEHENTLKSDTIKPPQQKLLLFMNTPENRAKLAGTNFNIINANLLSKISGQPQRVDKPGMNLINLKKCIKLNNAVKQNESLFLGTNNSSKCSNNENNSTDIQNIISLSQKSSEKSSVLPVDIISNGFPGFIRKDKENQEIDSGYESPTSSSSSSPCSPPIELERKDVMETIQYIDIPPHERQPFYLSEEEKRTLIMEGLPVPAGLPLNKIEERALKKVRRKIKNKISAQESRRKKKEYMESLEKKVDTYVSENNLLKKKVNSLEVANRSLIIQVQKLQALVASKITPNSNSLTESSKSEENDS